MEIVYTNYTCKMHIHLKMSVGHAYPCGLCGGYSCECGSLKKRYSVRPVSIRGPECNASNFSTSRTPFSHSCQPSLTCIFSLVLPYPTTITIFSISKSNKLWTKVFDSLIGDAIPYMRSSYGGLLGNTSKILWIPIYLHPQGADYLPGRLCTDFSNSNHLAPQGRVRDHKGHAAKPFYSQCTRVHP